MCSLWDHRNASLRQWLIDEYVMGALGMGSGVVDGIFIDDFWSNRSFVLPWSGGDCATMPTGGPTEVDGHCIDDMGLAAADVREIWEAWNATMRSVFQSVVAAKGYVYQMLNENAGRDDADPRPQCAAWLRESCEPGSPASSQPLLFRFTDETTRPLPYPEQDVAMFLLVRGDFAWIGYSWDGCTEAIDAYEVPPILNADFGAPVDANCRETAPGSGGGSSKGASQTRLCRSTARPSWQASLLRPSRGAAVFFCTTFTTRRDKYQYAGS